MNLRSGKKAGFARYFAQVVVDAKHVFFAETTVHHRVQRLRRGKVMAERFFEDDARALGATRFAEPMNDGLEQAGRNGEIVHRLLRVAQFPS